MSKGMKDTPSSILAARILKIADLADAMEAIGSDVSRLDKKINELHRVQKKLSYFIRAARA